MREVPVNQRVRIHLLQFAGVIFGLCLLLTHPVVTGQAHEIIEMVGFFLVLACVAGRMWSILYVGARKNRELVTAGPYSMTRNPLYVFSTLGAVGVGLMLGSFIAAIGLGLVVYLVLNATAAKEAEHLRTLFGRRYDDYAARTPMFWPNPSLYKEPEEVSFSPRALTRTFLDALLFLMAFPLVELIEHLQIEGYLPILFRFI